MRFALLAPSSCLVPVVVVVLSSPAWLRPPGADGHGFLAKPPSKNGGDQTTRGEETAIYYSVASFGIIDKAYFDGDHSLTPWTRPGEFDHVMAREVVPGHPQTLHPCGCNAGGVAHCVGVEVATGFGETTLGAAPGVPPVLVPPEWPAGTSQEVGWNAYANHAGGYVYTMCPRDRYDSCRDTHLPHGPHLAGEEDTEAYLRCVWDCFEASTLGWVQDSQRVQYRDEACTYAITDPLTKVGRGGHVWRSTPIPDKGQVSSGNEGQCTWDSVVGFSSAEAEDRFTESFGTSDVCDYGPHQRSTKDWHVMDRVEIPSDLPEGEYLLGWRWDAYMADQMWTGCADVRIVAPSSASPQDPDCPTGPPTAGPPPPPPTTTTMTTTRSARISPCQETGAPGGTRAPRTRITGGRPTAPTLPSLMVAASAVAGAGRAPRLLPRMPPLPTRLPRTPPPPLPLPPTMSARTSPSRELGETLDAPAPRTRITGGRPTAPTQTSPRAAASAAADPSTEAFLCGIQGCMARAET